MSAVAFQRQKFVAAHFKIKNSIIHVNELYPVHIEICFGQTIFEAAVVLIFVMMQAATIKDQQTHIYERGEFFFRKNNKFPYSISVYLHASSTIICTQKIRETKKEWKKNINLILFYHF